MLRGKCGIVERMGAQAQRMCGPLDERSAAARTRFVEDSVRHHAILNPERLHVLPADVEHERRVGHELHCRASVRRCLHDARIDAERRAQQVLAVSRRRGVRDPGGRFVRAVDAGERPFEIEQLVGRGGECVAPHRRIAGINKVARIIDNGHLHRGRSRVYP